MAGSTTATSATVNKPRSETSFRSDLAILCVIALATVVLHLIFGNRYGIHRDELATLDDARHLAWGYVAYPPVTPFFGRISLMLFGTSIRGFRLFANIAMAIVVVLTGLMTGEMGGRRGAQLVAAVAVVPYCLGAGALMQYVAFDALAWVLTAYFVVRLLKSGDARWWIGIGIAIGLGMLTKWTMGFFTLGIVGGVLLTDARRYLKSKWLWIGVGLSILTFLPNVLWQAQNHFISLDMLKHIHARDIGEGRTAHFLPQQLMLTGLRTVLALAGLYFCFVAQAGRRFRMIGWMYLITLGLFVILRGRWYYMGPAYPMLYAAGSVWGESWRATMARRKAMAVRTFAWAALAFDIAVTSAFFMPLAPLGSKWWKAAASVQGDYKEELGWPELVQEVARIRDSLSPAEREHLALLGTNYGEAGAINLYGPQYGLPQAISGVNSFWVRGYGNPEPQTVIILGLDQEYVEKRFTACRLAGHTPNPYGVKNEETEDHPDIFVCGPPKAGWPEFWKHFRYFG
jgi:Dolichyl-phosphate-mannose-protein mannosyltransferase